MPESPETIVEIGYVARRFDVCPSTIRTWEESGLIPKSSRTTSGRRIWRDLDFADIESKIKTRRVNRLVAA